MNIPKPQEPSMSFTTGVIAVLIFSVGYYFVVSFFSGSSQSGERSEAAKMVDVCLHSQREIKKYLKYPESAKFPSCSTDYMNMTISNSTNNYTVNGYLEAKNDLGFLVPQNYNCSINLGYGKDEHGMSKIISTSCSLN